MDRLELPHGTVVALERGLPVEIRDRNDHVHATLDWDGDRLSAAVFPVRPAVADGHDAIIITGELVPHPVLGASHRVLRSTVIDEPSAHVASCAAVRWAVPDRLPAVDRPAALPASSGTAILNLIALLARGADVATLRYRGPYPTAALWSTLLECFRPVADAAAARDRFLRDAEAIALAGEPVEIPIDFAPAPFERLVVAPAVWAQLRGGVERVSIHDRSYAWDAAIRRLVTVDTDDRVVAAQLWIAGAPWHEVARFSGDGTLLDGPHPRPPLDSHVIGQVFPPALVAALAELCADGEPVLLAPSMRQALAATPMIWGDAGDEPAVADPRGVIVVHALLWERLASRGLGALAIGLAEALTPLARRLGQALLASRIDD
jgi:hypothetical protein